MSSIVSSKYLLDEIYNFEASWNMYQSGVSEEFSDEDQIIQEFYSNFSTTLRARYSRKRK